MNVKELAQKVKECLLKERRNPRDDPKDVGRTIWDGIVRLDCTSNSGCFSMGELSMAIAEELMWEAKETPEKIATPAIVNPAVSCAGLTLAGKQCSRRSVGSTGFCSLHGKR